MHLFGRHLLAYEWLADHSLGHHRLLVLKHVLLLVHDALHARLDLLVGAQAELLDDTWVHHAQILNLLSMLHQHRVLALNLRCRFLADLTQVFQ